MRTTKKQIDGDACSVEVDAVVITPKDRYRKALENIVDEFDKIDKDVFYNEREPKWWLDMMYLTRDIIRRKAAL